MGGAVPPLPHTPQWRGAQGEHRVQGSVTNWWCMGKALAFRTEGLGFAISRIQYRPSSLSFLSLKICMRFGFYAKLGSPLLTNIVIGGKN